jgi:hypothetical protein
MVDRFLVWLGAGTDIYKPRINGKLHTKHGVIS